MDFSIRTNREDKLGAHIQATKSFHPDSWRNLVQNFMEMSDYDLCSIITPFTNITSLTTPLSPLSLRFHHSDGFPAQNFRIIWRASQCHNTRGRGRVARRRRRARVRNGLCRKRRGGTGGETPAS